ncbi:MAG: transporter [Desulfovibrio sp.]|jgi:hypothetical protein|nr:transporter [Desulfovibrio sp.]
MKRFFVFLVLGALLLSGGKVLASTDFHYLPGAEGIKAPVLPPEGFYGKWYAGWKSAGTTKNDSGGNTGANTRNDTFLLLNRAIWSTGIQVLGADLVTSITLPIIQSRTSSSGENGFKEDAFSIGDIELNPFLLGWHGEWWDLLIGLSVYIPSGYYDSNNPMNNTGHGYWAIMPDVGLTVYFDKEKTWSASVLARYEFPTQQWGTNMTPGQYFHVDWALAKQFNEYFEFGVVGTCSWQTTRASTVGGVEDNLYRTFAIGPEVIFNIPSWGASISLRSEWAFETRNAMEGNLTMLSFTKTF